MDVQTTFCACGLPRRHEGRHRKYATRAEAITAHQASKRRHSEKRYQQLRANGACIEMCGRQSQRFARCRPCREKRAAQLAERRRQS